MQYGQSLRKEQLVELKSESRSLQQLLEQEAELPPITSPVQTVESHLTLQQHAAVAEVKIESHSITADLLPTAPMTLNPPAVLVGLANDAQIAVAGSSAELPENQTETEATPLKARPPNYPWRARKLGLEGFVVLEFSVDSAGQATDVAVLDAMPAGVFEKAASKALSKWKFAAADDSGSRYRQVFDFELKDIERGPPRSRTCALTGTRTCGIISPGVFVVLVNETTRSPKVTRVN
jgi:protein TonB